MRISCQQPLSVWPSGPRTLRWTCSTTAAARCAGPPRPRAARPSSKHPPRSTSWRLGGRHLRRAEPSATAAAAVLLRPHAVLPRARGHSPQAAPPVARSARRQSACHHGDRRPGRRRVRHRDRPRKGGPRDRATAAGSDTADGVLPGCAILRPSVPVQCFLLRYSMRVFSTVSPCV